MTRGLILFALSVLLSYTSAVDICGPCESLKKNDVLIVECINTTLPNIDSTNTTFECKKDSTIDLVLAPNNFDIKFLEKIDLTNVKSLNISGNKIQQSSFSLNKSAGLISLDVSSNNLSVFDVDFVLKFPSLLAGNWSHNVISKINGSTGNTSALLSHLDLSHNNLSSLDASSFKQFSNLTHLNLSHNCIDSIENGTFTGLIKLEFLSLENNCLKSVEFYFPPSLMYLFLGNDQHVHSSKMMALSSDKNNQTVCKNSLSKLSNNTVFKSLKKLDISFNNFTAFPVELSSKNFPALETLDISGNPIKNLSFPQELKVDHLIMKKMDLLEKLDDNVFQNITPNSVKTVKPNSTEIASCINITLASNSNNQSINIRAFYNTSFNICNLDLSDNNLSTIVVDAKSFKWNGTQINLQGNSFVCSCSMQWTVRGLNKSNPDLLNNLNCSANATVPSISVAEWFNSTGNKFCNSPLNKTVNLDLLVTPFFVNGSAVNVSSSNMTAVSGNSTVSTTLNETPTKTPSNNSVPVAGERINVPSTNASLAESPKNATGAPPEPVVEFTSKYYTIGMMIGAACVVLLILLIAICYRRMVIKRRRQNRRH